MNYLGDFPQDQTIYFAWSTNDVNGAAITRATDGTIQIYKDDGVAQDTTDITDTEDFDSLTGIHMCKIVTTAAFYAPAHDYSVVLQGATIDSQSVAAVLASFSIENRTGSPQAGAGEYTYTVKDGSSNAIEGVDVWISTDAAGSIVIWRGVTNASGVAVETAGDSKPWLDAGTYYFWCQKSGYSFSNPDSETVS